MKFLRISWVGQNEIKRPWKFSLSTKGLVEHWENAEKVTLKCSEISTLQNREIKMQQK